MSIFSGSRYGRDENWIVGIEEDDEMKKMVLRLSQLTPEDVEDFETYVIQSGDRFDTLAETFGKDASKWWVIAEVNNFVDFPLDLVPGTVIRIPTPAFFSAAA